MSKIGRKPIKFTTAKVEVVDGHVRISGPKAKLEHQVPPQLTVQLKDGALVLAPAENARDCNVIWGLHRALLANKIQGVERGFEQTLRIVGLGFKAQLAGKKLVLSIGFSHKIEYALPAGVEVDVDKTGQQLVFKGTDKLLVGNVCDTIRSFRPPEPYKGTGIMRADEVIIRKAGKTK